MMVMVLVAVSTVLGLGYLVSSTVRLASIDNLMHAARARYLAESGLQHGLWLLRRNPEAVLGAATGPLGPYQADETADSYSFWAEPVVDMANVYKITSTATVGDLTRTVSMKVRFTSRYKGLLLGKSPLTYWRLGETAGWSAHDTMGYRDGVYVGGGLLDQPSAVPHNNVNDFVDLGGMDVWGQALTVLAWFRVQDWSRTDGRIVCKAKKDGDADQYWTVRTISKDGQIRLKFSLRTNGSAGHVISNIGDYCPAGEWIFAACVYDGNEMFIYQDGVEVGKAAKTGQIDTAPWLRACIGGSPNEDSSVHKFWQGNIDEVAILLTALTPAQVKELYDARLPDVEILSWGE
ncbi:MAG: LamG domain-containing protein [Planctomycetota bacterium]|jgi:hypothetical protein